MYERQSHKCLLRTWSVHLPLRLDALDFCAISVEPHLALSLFTLPFGADVPFSVHSNVPIPVSFPLPISVSLAPAVELVRVASAATRTSAHAQSDGRSVRRHGNRAQLTPWAARARSKGTTHAKRFAPLRVAPRGRTREANAVVRH